MLSHLLALAGPVLPYLCLPGLQPMGEEEQQLACQLWPSLIFRLQILWAWFWRSDPALTFRKAVHPQIYLEVHLHIVAN